MMKEFRISLALCALTAAITAPAQHITETLSLEKGWNAVYLESTPEEADCDAFFAALPVTQAGAYVTDAYDDTEQYNSDGTERNQKPVSYRMWNRNGHSSLPRLTGGAVYLIYATNACEATFLGVPHPPRFTWRKASATDAEAVVNLVGVSLPPGTKPFASAYFKEGPFGPKGTLWTVGGTGENPVFKAPFSSSSARVEPGRAYAVTATAAGRWPGVIGLSFTSLEDGVVFDAGQNTASVRLTNRGVTNRAFRVTYSASAKTDEALPPLMRRVAAGGASGGAWTNVVENDGWTYELAPDESAELVFGVSRSWLDRGKVYGGVLAFEDQGGTQMRVRVPVRVDFPAEGSAEAAYPAGLWIGRFVFSRVTYGDEKEPTAAEGVLKPTVIFNIDGQGRMKLLQRVSLVRGTNGQMRVFRDFNAARAVDESARRITSLMLDPANQIVDAARGGFGDEAEFRYAVDQDGAGNPFRHVWHPDHDGLDATYENKARAGSELWSVTNTVTMQFRETGTGADYYSSDIDEIRAGRVVWTVEGLRTQPVTAEGIFSIQRLVPAATLE